MAITLDMDALMFQSNPTALSLLNSFSEQMTGQPLPPVSQLISAIEADFAALLNLLTHSV